MKRAARKLDPWLFWLTVFATIVGALAIFDAGYARSIKADRGVIPREFLTQIMLAGVGLVAMLTASRIPAERLRRWATGIATLTVVALALVETPLGTEMNGVRRWIDLKVLMLQPAEFAKLGVVLALAAWFAGRKPWKPNLKGIRNWGHWMDRVAVPKLKRSMPAMFLLLVVFLIEKGPDLGTAFIVLVTGFCMFIFGGVSRRSLVACVVIGSVGVGVMTIQQPYRMDRIIHHGARWDDEHRDDVGYQTVQSETAMANAGALGVGVGAGRAKHMLPAATTDFVLATVAEELGLVGSLAVLGLLGAIAWRLLQLAERAATPFGRLVLMGISMWIGIQSAINVLMANGTLPAIGIPLPFISSGGSSLLALMLAMGVAQSMAMQPAVDHAVVEEGANEAGRDRRGHGRTRLSRA